LRMPVNPMSDSPDIRDPVELLAEEFAARCRRGENPSVFEYVAEHPQYARQIETLFPTVAMMEQLRLQERTRREAAVRHGRSAPPPEHIGDFDVIREIGRGGMGIVYEAIQRSLRRRVAVKVLPKHALLLEKHLRRFQREAQTAAALHHTNIVPVFGVGEQDGLHYYVMPLVRGVGLDEIIRELRRAAAETTEDAPRRDGPAIPDRDVRSAVRASLRSKGTNAPDDARDNSRDDARNALGGPLFSGRANPWRTVAQIGLQAAEALDYAHAQGTLHRDVKPGNLLVDAEGVVHVADFGLARAVEAADESLSGEVVGTPRYMAPEQLHGRTDARSDVYALGLTLYELMTLRPAFDPAERRSGGNGRQPGSEPLRPRKIAPAVPRDLETIVLKCLAEEPSRRYQTAAALAADLRLFLDDKPIRARRVSSVERAWRWCRRNPALAAVSGLAAALLVAVVATALLGHLRTRRAYVETKTALTRAEATSHVALEALEDIYVQLSPDRVWISSDSDPGGEACACIGLRSGVSSPVDRPLTQVQASEKTAALLENLLVFYDRLAEQISDDRRVMLESAIASRRVGDIRQRLGRIDHAEEEYRRALKKLDALDASSPANVEVCVERARCYNEIGNVRSAKYESERAYQAHEEALAALRPFAEDGVEKDGPAFEECRYELARTYYFLGTKHSIAFDDRRGDRSDAGPQIPSSPPYRGKEHRKSAIRILEALVEQRPDAPDYRFLLALCHRPPGVVPEPARGSADSRGRQRALRLLEDLKREYPQVADYRYELAATYAWVHVGLFPWQGRSTSAARAEEGLRRALDESEWLVGHNPTIPQFARSKALILAKLGTICRETGRGDEAEHFFADALKTQEALVAGFSEPPPHDRVLVEFMRLRLGETGDPRRGEADDPDASRRSVELLQTCVRNLTELAKMPELTDDRLAPTSLQAARDALVRTRAATDSDQGVDPGK